MLLSVLSSRGTYRQNGSSLHFKRSGQGRPVLLIHGLSGSEQWWRHNIGPLQAGHSVYVVDLAGYGAAHKQAALGVRAEAELVCAWIRAENLQHVTLVGHSMGGQIAIYVAAMEPERISGLVLACASGLLKTSFYRTALQLPRAAFVGRKRFLPRILFDAARAGPVNLWRSTNDLLKNNVQDILPKITAPTLVVWGERDPLVPLPLGRLLAEKIPHAALEVIPRAGHVVMVDAPARFNALLLEFMKSTEEELEK